jgi:hypothetical protein
MTTERKTPIKRHKPAGVLHKDARLEQARYVARIMLQAEANDSEPDHWMVGLLMAQQRGEMK